jgi:hypothetical protein
MQQWRERTEIVADHVIVLDSRARIRRPLRVFTLN